MPSVAIIGAGPAGCAAAFHLAQAGFSIDLFESRRFPRVKVCGEFISPAATHLLESLIPASDLHAAGARRVHEFVLEIGPRAFVWPLPTPAWALSRASLDQRLLERARAAGARLHQPAPVRRVQYHNDRVDIETADGAQYSADLIIHADGFGRHDPAGPTPVDQRFLACKCHFRPRTSTIAGVRIHTAPGAYIGTIAVEDGLNTCALVARRELITHHHGDADALLNQLWPGRDWNRHGDWETCPLPRSRYITPGHPRSFRIGNAAAAVDPVGGEGIGLALWAGQTLGQSLQPKDANSLERLTAIQQQFKRLYRRRLRTRLPACRLASACLVRPRLVNAVWPALRMPRFTIAPWYRLTGKSIASQR